MVAQNRRWRFHGLKKPKIRQDWTKYTLYNISRMSRPNTSTRTYFQQKWTAKASTRAYHGEQVMEKKWCRLFDRRTPAVVPMDPKALAEDDGAKYAAGRGRGKEMPPEEKKQTASQIPYMQMVYHPTERRLDTAIFRSLFASSARQARQFVTHGHVKVNGKRMIYPSYMLNPGDMFQVDPESVLLCTGTVPGRRRGKRRLYQNEQGMFASGSFQHLTKSGKAVPSRAESGAQQPDPATTVATSPNANQELMADEEEKVAETAEEELTEEEAAVEDDDPAAATKKTILFLRAQSIDLEAHPPKGKKLSGKQKQELRLFRKTLKSFLSKARTMETSAIEDLQQQWSTMSERIEDVKGAAPTASEDAAKHDEANPGPSAPPPPGMTQTPTTPDGDSVPIGPDGSPVSIGPQWTPKIYMSAFAFIPRYLEVNHSIMAAVYLRHPVCKPGFAEVPTPFHPETGQLTFNWYLRRR